MRLLLLPLIFAAGSASAHVGHVGELAGHDHWVAGAAIGVAAAISLWGVLKGKKEEASDDSDPDADPEEAEA